MLATGIDLIEIVRIQRAVERWGERFLRRVFTTIELADCGLAPDSVAQSRRADSIRVQSIAHTRYASLAARWAAKEATAKALGVGLRGLAGQRCGDSLRGTAIGLTEVEVVRDTLGRPRLRLYGFAAQVAAAQGLAQFGISLSHTRQYALASVVALAICPLDL